MKGGIVSGDFIRQDMNHRGRASSTAKKIDPIYSLECGNHHSYAGAIQFWLSMILKLIQRDETSYSLISSLPDTIIWCSISSLDIENKILDKLNFVDGINDMQSANCHLRKEEQKNSSSIELKVAPCIISNNSIPSSGVVSTMNVLRVKKSTLHAKTGLKPAFP